MSQEIFKGKMLYAHATGDLSTPNDIVATPGATNKLYIYGVILNSSAAATITFSNAITLGPLNVTDEHLCIPIDFTAPIRGVANTKLTVAVSAGTGTVGVFYRIETAIGD